MASKNMSKCFLCGAEYEVCKMCASIIHYTPWRTQCDTARHWQIYTIVKDVRAGALKKDEAKAQLDQLKVTEDEVKTFVSSVQDTLLPFYAPAQKVEVEENKPHKNTKKNIVSDKRTNIIK